MSRNREVDGRAREASGVTVPRSAPRGRGGRFVFREARGLALLLVSLLGGCARAAEQPIIDVAAALSGADTLRVAQLMPGVRHVYAWDRGGPWAIHVIEVLGGECMASLEARKAGPPLAARATTSRLGEDAVAAINADFFGLPAGTTIGAHASSGRLLIGPSDWPVFAVADDAYWIGPGRIAGHVIRGADTLAVSQVNRRSTGSAQGAAAPGAYLFDVWSGESASAEPAEVGLRVRLLSGEGSGGTGVVLQPARRGGEFGLDSATMVLLGRARAADWLARAVAGDTLTWHVALVPADSAGGPEALEAVGGFPRLLRSGEIAPEVAETSPGFGEGRHPRTAIGIAADGRALILVVVDGRQDPYSVGMSLAELAELLQRIGAVEALNLDGGGSTAMIIDGKVASRPSDPAGERPVGNALALLPGQCGR